MRLSRTASQRVRVGLPMAHDAISGEPVCWSYLQTRCNDSGAAEKLLAEHGRTAHRLHETWRVEMKETLTLTLTLVLVLATTPTLIPVLTLTRLR